MTAALKERIFTISDENEFSELALEIFSYQYHCNSIYRSFSDYLGRDPHRVRSISEIPFLPVEFFRDHMILSGKEPAASVFESSSTTGAIPGKHYVTDLSLYEESFVRAFRLFYGAPSEYVLVALLPSYVERGSSSLVYMADRLIKLTRHPASGFYRHDTALLLRTLGELKGEGRKILLLGVSYALLDLAEAGQADLSHVTVMETGGMKGRRRELIREELHSILKRGLNVEKVHSEYGMTELLSQAYSGGDGIFRTPPWMKIVIRDPQDPLFIEKEEGKTGGINIIDLANLNSCSFISTGDLGKLIPGGSFGVLGRFDNRDVRGCNLMAG